MAADAPIFLGMSMQEVLVMAAQAGGLVVWVKMSIKALHHRHDDHVDRTDMLEREMKEVRENSVKQSAIDEIKTDMRHNQTQLVTLINALAERRAAPR